MRRLAVQVKGLIPNPGGKEDEPMRVTVTQMLEIPDLDVSVKSIEEAVARAARGFPSAAWQAAVHCVETRAASQHPAGSFRLKACEPRTLWTTSGPVTFRRRRFVSEDEQRSFLLFDLRVGLRPRRRTTAGADRLLAETAAEATYSAAARFWARAWGEAPSAMAVWRATQRAGEDLVAERERLRRRVFEDGDLPGWEKPPPEFVGVEADSTYVAAWRGKGASHEVYVGISYDGKEERRGRRRLKGKAVRAALGGAKRFGEELFASAQSAHNVTEAKAGVYLSDGAASLRVIQQDHFPRLARQLDWAHAKRRVSEAYGREQSARSSELIGRLAAGEREAVVSEVRSDAGRKRRRAEELRELAGYLEGPGADLYAVRRLRATGAELPGHLEGSGGIERQIGVLVGQRMKRRGMSWTRRGAERMLAVRQHLLNRLHPS